MVQSRAASGCAADSKSVIAAIHKRRHSAIIRGSDAGIAQLVEHDLAKVGVASSSLVSRSSFSQSLGSPGFCFFQATCDHHGRDAPSNGQVAEWSCSGLQSRVRRFDSDLGLHCAKAVVQPSKPAAGGFFVAAGCRTPTLRLAPGLELKSVAGARGGGRTRIALRRRDFKSLAYTSFATRAGCRRALQARLQAVRIVACA